MNVNPSAADTVDGIQAIWIRGSARREVVQRAVDALVERGIMIRKVLPDGSVLFARAPLGGR